VRGEREREHDAGHLLGAKLVAQTEAWVGKGTRHLLFDRGWLAGAAMARASMHLDSSEHASRL
jgi:hypothetical protein